MPTYIPGADVDREINDLHRAVGEALSSWASVELQLVTIFYHAMGRNDHGNSYEVMKAVVSFNARLAMVGRATTRTLQQGHAVQLLEVWRPLFKRCENLSRVRNQLAHGQVTCIADRPDSDGIQEHLGVRLSDPIGRNLRRLTPKQQLVESLNLSQVQKASEDFHALGVDLSRFEQDWARRTD